MTSLYKKAGIPVAALTILHPWLISGDALAADDGLVPAPAIRELSVPGGGFGGSARSIKVEQIPVRPAFLPHAPFTFNPKNGSVSVAAPTLVAEPAAELKYADDLDTDDYDFGDLSEVRVPVAWFSDVAKSRVVGGNIDLLADNDLEG